MPNRSGPTVCTRWLISPAGLCRCSVARERPLRERDRVAVAIMTTSCKRNRETNPHLSKVVRCGPFLYLFKGKNHIPGDAGQTKGTRGKQRGRGANKGDAGQT